MVAYRLHFDVAHLDAIDIARDSDFGSMRFFTSAFTRQIRDRDNIRLKKERGGGPLYDLGVYAINAARYLFRAEPLEVSAFMESSEDARFREVEEMVSAVLRFPENKLASFTASFGAAESSWYELYGAKSHIRMEPAYEYAEPLSLVLKVGGEKPKNFSFAREDQFAPLLIHLSDCILNSRDVGPSAVEGMADVKIIEAIRESAFTGRAVSLQNIEASVNRPSSSQGMTIPPVRKPGLVHAVEPSQPVDPGQLKGDSKKTA
jgi:glucose-fructose oxidoreductase